MPKDYKAVAITKNTRTVRERRRDATHCDECGAAKMVLWDYVPDLPGRPAFCNRTCWQDYEFGDRVRRPSAMEEAPDARESEHPQKRKPPGTKRPKGPRYLAAVG